MSHPFFPMEAATDGNLHVGDVISNDPEIIDDDLREIDRPPTPVSEPIDGVPLTGLTILTKTLTGTLVVNPSWTEPVMLLPGDRSRVKLVLGVQSPDTVFVGVISTVGVAAAQGVATLPLGASLSGFQVDFQASTAPDNFAVTVNNTASGTLTYDGTTSSTVGNVISDSFRTPLLPVSGQQINVTVPAIVGGPAYTINAYYTLPMSNFVRWSSDKRDLQVDPTMGLLASNSAGTLYANPESNTVDFGAHTGPVWISSIGSQSACTVSYWSVCE